MPAKFNPVSNAQPVASLTQGWGRRQFIKAGATALGASLLPQFPVFAGSNNPGVGLQLYTLRDWMAVSVPATLKMVASVGYKEMEFAGYYSLKPSEVRSILNGEGMTAPSAHIQLTDFAKGTNEILDAALEIGHQYLVVPFLTEEQRGTHIDTYKALAQKLNEIGEACQKAGIKLGYHNHDFEFETRQGQVPYDVLLGDTDPALVSMEMDLFWTIKAGRDPLAYFNSHPGRFKMWHVKDMDASGNMCDVGAGQIDFASIFAAADKAGVEHYFVEHDMSPNKLQTIQQGYSAVSTLLG